MVLWRGWMLPMPCPATPSSVLLSVSCCHSAWPCLETGCFNTSVLWLFDIIWLLKTAVCTGTSVGLLKCKTSSQQRLIHIDVSLLLSDTWLQSGTSFGSLLFYRWHTAKSWKQGMPSVICRGVVWEMGLPGLSLQPLCASSVLPCLLMLSFRLFLRLHSYNLFVTRAADGLLRGWFQPHLFTCLVIREHNNPVLDFLLHPHE